MSRSRQMAHLTKELSQAAQFRKAAIEAMREATQATLVECAQMRGEMVRDYRAQMHRFLSALVRDVAAHRRAIAHQIAQTQKFLGAEARHVAAKRNDTMNEIARVRNARGRAANGLRRRLQHQVAAIATRSVQLRDAAADAVVQLANAHRKMAKEQKAELKSGRRKLRATTSKVVGAMHADRMKAHEVWSDFKLGRAA